MRAPRWIWLLLVAAAARGDVVHLTSGRAIQGEVIEETATKVVVRVPGSGKLEFPRKLVRSIERTDAGASRLALARERRKSGALDEARRIYRALAEDPDPAIREPARRELAELEREVGARETPPQEGGAAPPAGPVAEPGVPEGAHTPWSKGVAALREGRLEEAEAIFRQLLADAPSSRRYAYLYARTRELQGERAEAGKRYRALVGDLGKRSGLTPAWLGEVARRQLGGEGLEADSPGVGERWRRVEAGPDFVIYHPFPKIEPWLRAAPEQALEHVLERLELKRAELAWSGRTQVFLFENKRAYEQADGMQLASGHAQQFPAPDGLLIQIRAYPLRSFYQTTFPHEIAHGVLFVFAPTLSGWAHEGAAQFVESSRARAQARGAVRGAEAAGTLTPWASFLAGARARGDDQAAVSVYYGQALVAFEALVDLAGGPREALAWCVELSTLGVEPSFARRRVSWDRFEQALDRAAHDTSAGD
ncbi:MAG: hypothetical protein R3F62_08330 [Planctomycetota bacterium]